MEICDYHNYFIIQMLVPGIFFLCVHVQVQELRSSPILCDEEDIQSPTALTVGALKEHESLTSPSCQFVPWRTHSRRGSRSGLGSKQNSD